MTQTHKSGHATTRPFGGTKTPALSFPEDTYLIDESRNLIYMPIPKVACTSLKIWFVMTSLNVRTHPDPAAWKINAWLGNEGNCYLLKDLAPLSDGRTFRFAFVRNPWSRLVSSYLNRIVGRGIEHWNVMKRLSRGPWFRLDQRIRYHVRKRLYGIGWPESAELTFRQFVIREVASMPVMEMDPHWRPQYTFLGSYQTDFIGRFERLTEDLEVLAKRLKISVALPELNRSQYVDRSDGRCFADCPQAQLRAMPAMPHYRQFYTRDLINIVARIYTKDIDRFGYDF